MKTSLPSDKSPWGSLDGVAGEVSHTSRADYAGSLNAKTPLKSWGSR